MPVPLKAYYSKIIIKKKSQFDATDRRVVRGVLNQQ